DRRRALRADIRAAAHHGRVPGRCGTVGPCAQRRGRRRDALVAGAPHDQQGDPDRPPQHRHPRLSGADRQGGRRGDRARAADQVANHRDGVMSEEEEGYRGPATLIVDESELDVTVTLRGYFEPIDGFYHWYGRINTSDALTNLLAGKNKPAVLRTPAGEAPG